MNVTPRISEHSVDGRRRALDWSQAPRAAIAALAPARRARIGAAWKFRMEQEHLAVSAFSRLTADLAETGADPVVLALTTRAASDEVRHFAICRDYAALFLGEGTLPTRLRGGPRARVRPDSALRDRTLLDVVEMCCLSETLTGLYFTEMHARTTDPFARTVVESLLEDEIHHGRVGWTHVANACREGWGRAPIETHLPELVDRAVGQVLRLSAQRRESDHPDMEALAWLGNDTGAAIYREGLRDVILPGLDEVGIDTHAIRRTAGDAGWLD